MVLNDDIKLYKGDCLEIMKNIPDKTIDMILCDLPYGCTDCKWDTRLPFEPLWEQYNRIIKDNGAIALFGSEPFSTLLRSSNLKMYKYDWIWLKSTSAGFVNAKNMPMRRHENISVFSKASIGHKSCLGDKRMIYNPQGLIPVNKVHKRPSTSMVNIISPKPSHKKEFKVEFENYPNSLLDFPNSNNKLLHPTQKPVPLLEYLIKTYTNDNENAVVLDNCMGSGSTGVACINTNRKFIGIELDDKYFEIAKDRIENTYKNNI